MNFSVCHRKYVPRLIRSSKFLNKKIEISFTSYESLPCKCTVTAEKNIFHSYLNCEVSRPDFVSREMLAVVKKSLCENHVTERYCALLISQIRSIVRPLVQPKSYVTLIRLF